MGTKLRLGSYRHSKSGKEYRVLGLAKHSETLEDLVLYSPLYKNPIKLWVRPLRMFLEKVVINRKKLPRFQFLKEKVKSTYELETKVLGVNKEEIEKKMEQLRADKVLGTRFQVIWYRKKGWGEGENEWFLRIRSDGEGKNEVTWKAKSVKLGVSRTHKEINFEIGDPKSLEQLFLVLGLERYAYQEKDRVSWVLKSWRFDLDQYPEMPAYLEIEGKSEKDIHEAIKLLGIEKHETSSEGERVLIQKKYGLDWYEMRF